MNRPLWVFYLLSAFMINLLFATSPSALPKEAANLYRWVANPQEESLRINNAQERLQQAISNPEFLLAHWVDLPTSPDNSAKKAQHLSLREAILLALRYNPNIQNAELDRIIQRYQLRLAHNQFELQYAVAGSAVLVKSRYENAGETTNANYLATPEFNLQTKLGTQISLNMANNVANYNSYTPVLNFSVTQPLLQGFGPTVNQANLLNAIDSEALNKLNVRQAITNQITEVIVAYRALILSGNNLENQRYQLAEARKSYEINEKKIEAGQLEPTANIQQAYQIESLNLMVEQAHNDFKVAAQELLQAIGLDPQMRLAVPNNLTVEKIIVPPLQPSIDLALKNNTQYLAQQMNLRAAERAYKVAKNQQLWQLDLGLGVQSGMVTEVEGNRRGLQSIYNGRNLTETAGLTLKIPVRDLNRRSQLINAKVAVEKEKITLLAMKRALQTSITNLITSIQSQAKRYQLAQKQVKLAEQSYSLEKKKQQAGIATALDVSNTQNQLIQAQIGLMNAKIGYLNQLSDLERLLGTTLEHWKINLRYGE